MLQSYMPLACHIKPHQPRLHFPHFRSVAKIQRGTSLKLNFTFAYVLKTNGDLVSETFIISDLTEVRFKYNCINGDGFLYIAWKKHESVTEAFTVKIMMNINTLCGSILPFPKQINCSENWTDWVKIYSFKSGQSILECMGNRRICNALVTLCVCKVEKILFPKLFEDDEFCDFNLNTVDGSGTVPVHKACLIVHSDIFKRMLSTEWKETINGCIKIQGVALQNLRHLKEYFYLGTLPDENMQIQVLLLIAKCYMIENLMTECIVKLAVTVKPEEFYSLQEFAIDNKMPELIQAIIEMTPDETVHAAYLKKAGMKLKGK